MLDWQVLVYPVIVVLSGSHTKPQTVEELLKILKEVFTLDPGGYNKSNAYWSSQSMQGLIDKCNVQEQHKLLLRVKKIEAIYEELSELYQANKSANEIPLK